MKIIFIIISFLLIGCGGGGSTATNATDSTTPTIIGLQGDINAIEPIDLD
mgnify:CR=1 FL=1